MDGGYQAAEPLAGGHYHQSGRRILLDTRPDVLCPQRWNTYIRGQQLSAGTEAVVRIVWRYTGGRVRPAGIGGGAARMTE